VQALRLLLRNEVRVRWRELTGETRASTLLLMGAVIFGGVHLILWFISRSLKGVLTAPLPPELVLLAALVVVVLFPFGVATGINHSVVALFDRGDLDLLGSSPVGSCTVFASRVIAVAASVFVALGLFMLPLASIGVLIGVPQLLGAVPTLAALSVVSASVGMLITLLLVRLLGARRARTTAQVLAAMSGALLFAASQIPNFTGGGERIAELVAPLARHFQPGMLLGPNSLLWLPFRSMFLHPLGTITVLAFAALVLWATVALLHRAFAHGIGLVESAPKRKLRDDQQVRFGGRGALRVLLQKEWKLILRDPFLISQVVLQTVYFIPAIYLLLFSDTSSFGRLQFAPALAAAITVLAGTVSTSLVRIAVVGEEAADLLAAAPVSGQLVNRAKMLVALVPVCSVIVPVALWALTTDLASGLALLVFAPVTSLAVVQMRVWNPASASRKDLFKRKALGDPVSTAAEFFVPLAMGPAAFLAATGSAWVLLPLAVAAASVAVAHARR